MPDHSNSHSDNTVKEGKETVYSKTNIFADQSTTSLKKIFTCNLKVKKQDKNRKLIFFAMQNSKASVKQGLRSTPGGQDRG